MYARPCSKPFALPGQRGPRTGARVGPHGHALVVILPPAHSRAPHLSHIPSLSSSHATSAPPLSLRRRRRPTLPPATDRRRPAPLAGKPPPPLFLFCFPFSSPPFASAPPCPLLAVAHAGDCGQHPRRPFRRLLRPTTQAGDLPLSLSSSLTHSLTNPLNPRIWGCLIWRLWVEIETCIVHLMACGWYSCLIRIQLLTFIANLLVHS